jgi:hypothetical protein
VHDAHQVASIYGTKVLKLNMMVQKLKLYLAPCVAVQCTPCLQPTMLQLCYGYTTTTTQNPVAAVAADAQLEYKQQARR